MARNYSRTPPPRQLGPNETLESLTHWQTSFKTFYKRDEVFKRFFKVGVTWDHNVENYGMQDDDEYSAEDMAEDLTDLLNTLAGYLPHSYLTDKIVRTSTCWKDVWAIIFEHYNVYINSESLLDFEDIHKQDDETYRQYYEKLLQHVKQHLAPAGVKVEKMINATPDEMSISLMNFVALQWMRKIDPTLIHIVKTEYSTELRKNTQLADLVPRIAPNVDSLLKRYNTGNTVINMMHEEKDAGYLAHTTIKKVKSVVKDAPFKPKDADVHKPTKEKTHNSNPFCPGCFYLSKQLKASIHFKHTPGDCPRKALAVKLFQVEDSEHFDTTHNSDNYGKDIVKEDFSTLPSHDTFHIIRIVQLNQILS